MLPMPVNLPDRFLVEMVDTANFIKISYDLVILFL